MPTDRARTQGFTASSGSPALRPIDYFLIGICIVALLAVGFVGSRASSHAQRAELAERNAKALNDTLQELQNQLAQLRGEVQSLKGFTSRLSTLEARVNESGNMTDEIRQMVRDVVEEDARTRRMQFQAEMDRRGDEFMNRLANDKRLEQGLMQAAERMRQKTGIQDAATQDKIDKTQEPPPQQADLAAQANAGDKTGRKEPDPIQEGIAQGAEKLAEGLKLWRDLQEGKITREQFDAQRQALEQDFRTAIEKNMTPEQREDLQRRIQEWRGRRQGGPQKPPPPVDEKF